MALGSQLALVARAAQGLWKAGLAEGGQLYGREDWQIQASRGYRDAQSPESSHPMLEEEDSAGQPGSMGTSLLLPHRCRLDPLTPHRCWHVAKT